MGSVQSALFTVIHTIKQSVTLGVMQRKLRDVAQYKEHQRALLVSVLERC